ncbi:MAG: hypothetical protein QG585_264 [Patescibacteria group bacterium]|nr:hypothetical protein [Patescibacteria group bacterium]
MFQKHSKFISTIVLCGLISSFLNPFVATKALAQALPTETGNDAASSALFPSGNSAQATGNVTSTDVSPGVAQSVGAAVGTCSVGALLGSIVSNYLQVAIGTLLRGATDFLSSSITSTVSSAVTIIVPRVPVKDDYVSGNTADLVNKEIAAGQGQRYDIISGLTKEFIKNPSFDAFGFCLGNAIIRYIGDATVAWIRGGFDGNPVYVDNPEAFFKNIADVEAGAFVTNVANGVGVDICAPFKVQVILNTLQRYSQNGYGNKASCSLSQIKNNYEQFVGGDWNSGGFPGWLELIQHQNNPYGATFLTRMELARQLESQKQIQEKKLDRNSGYQTITVCDKKRADGSFDPASCKDQTPAGYVKAQVEARAEAPLLRLTLADEFDEIVTELVNQFVKIAIDKMLQGSKN